MLALLCRLVSRVGRNADLVTFNNRRWFYGSGHFLFFPVEGEGGWGAPSEGHFFWLNHSRKRCAFGNQRVVARCGIFARQLVFGHFQLGFTRVFLRKYAALYGYSYVVGSNRSGEVRFGNGFCGEVGVTIVNLCCCTARNGDDRRSDGERYVFLTKIRVFGWNDADFSRTRIDVVGVFENIVDLLNEFGVVVFNGHFRTLFLAIIGEHFIRSCDFQSAGDFPNYAGIGR